MSIEIACTCGKRYQAHDDHAGREARCPACGRALVVPHQALEAGLVPLDADDETIPDEAGLVPLDRDDETMTTVAGADEEGLIPLDATGETRTDTKWEEEPITGGYDVASGSTGAKPNLASPVYGEIACFKLRRGDELPRCVAFSADSKRAYAAVGGTVFVLDPRQERVLSKHRIHGAAIECLAIAPDGRRALSATEGQNELSLWSLKTGETIATLAGHDAPVRSVTFSPDGRHALSGGDGGDVYVWDAATGQELNCLDGRLRGGIRTVAFSPDGKLIIAAGADGQVRLWNASTSRPLDQPEGATGEITTAVFARDGRFIAAAGPNDSRVEARLSEGARGTARRVGKLTSDRAPAIWRWETSTCDGVPYAGDSPQADGPITAVALASGGNRILFAWISDKPRSLAEIRGRTTLIDADSVLGRSGFLGGIIGAAIGALVGGALGMALGEGVLGQLGRYLFGLAGLVTGTIFGAIVGWFLGGVLVNMVRGARNPVEKCEHYLLQMWDIDESSRVMSYEGHHGPIRCLAVAPNGLLALSGSEDGTVRVWGVPP
jgi:WD40 repeat protein